MKKRLVAPLLVAALVAVPSVIFAASYDWSAVPDTIHGYSAAISDNGNIAYVGRVDAGSANAKVWKSTDGGSSWSVLANSPSRYSWLDLDSSSDGTKVVGFGYAFGASQTKLYRTGDSGVSWSVLSNSPDQEWSDVSMSGDGSTILGGAKFTGLWRSLDAGVTWTNVDPLPGAWWTGVAVSSDGQRMAAAHVSGGIWVSSNAGTTWTLATGTNILNWWAIDMSGDGQRLIAVNDNDDVTDGQDGIWTSSDFGVTWARSSVTVPLRKVGISRDGLTMAASLYGASMWLSSDGGSTWSISDAGSSTWTAIAISADGQRIIAVPELSSIKVGVSTTTTTEPPASSSSSSTTVAVTSSSSSSTSTSSTSSSTTATTAAAAVVSTTTSTIADSPTPVVTPSMIETFQAKPIVKDSGSIAAGEAVTVRISGFQPFELVSIGFDEDGVVQSQSLAEGLRVVPGRKVLTTVRADATGTISVQAKLPTTVSGAVTLWAYGRESHKGFRQKLTVAALPKTGTGSVQHDLMNVVLLILSGAGVLVIRRRFIRIG